MKLDVGRQYQELRLRISQAFAAFGLSPEVVCEYALALAILMIAGVCMVNFLGKNLPDEVIHLVTGGGA